MAASTSTSLVSASRPPAGALTPAGAFTAGKPGGAHGADRLQRDGWRRERLITAINNANNSISGASNIINLAASTYDLTAINNFWYGPDGLPAISSNLTINGNGATIQRDSSAANFRLFYVSGGFDGLPAGSLTLNNLTLEGGVAKGGNGISGVGGGLGAGGAIFNQGSVVLNGVTMTDNTAQGGSGGSDDSGGGGMGQDAQGNNGGGFGGSLGGTFGGSGGVGNAGSGAGGGGGGGFGLSDNGSNAASNSGGAGGGRGGFGGIGGGSSGGAAGDGGGGGSGSVGSVGSGGVGGGFGSGGGSEGGIGGGGGGGGGTTIFLLFRVAGGRVGMGGGGAGLGGGLFNMYGSLTLINCTLAGNTAHGGNGFQGGSGYGGALFNLDGTVTLTFCTVADNTVAAGTGNAPGNAAGGAIYNLAYGNTLTGGTQSATATLTDSILSNTTGGIDLVNNVVNGKNTNTATVTLSGPNLIMSSTGTIGGTTPLTADPKLGSLQNNGGPTPTMTLSTGSPASLPARRLPE